MKPIYLQCIITGNIFTCLNNHFEYKKVENLSSINDIKPQ